MKNIIIVIVLVLVVWAVFAGFKGGKLEAPLEVNDEVATENMPTIDEAGTEETSAVEDTDVEDAVVKEFVVSGKNFSFSPKLITVKQGDSVKITFKNTAGFHNFVIDEYGVAIKQAQAPAEGVVEFTADKVGSFEFYCSVGSHRAQGMFGILKVE